MNVNNLFIEKNIKENLTIVRIETPSSFKLWIKDTATEYEKVYLQNINYEPIFNTVTILPTSSGEISQILFIINLDLQWQAGDLAKLLPKGNYTFKTDLDLNYFRLFVGFALGSYDFEMYKKPKQYNVNFLITNTNEDFVIKYINAHNMARDLINTPANDMNPKTLSAFAKKLFEKYDGSFSEIVGKDLLNKNFNCIYAVGKAGGYKSRLIELTWGDSSHKKVTLVGKGVTFDNGGLDIKPASGMLAMHKDMGGAAHTLALAKLIMSNNLPINLKVLIPAVENGIDKNAYKPSDVIKSKKGITIQVTNTDAEGRLVLADALYEATLDNPDLIVDYATLTGAGRVALGLDIPAMFSNKKQTATDIQKISDENNDLVWHMPLYKNYIPQMSGSISDLVNATLSPYGGAILAGLFLQKFVEKSSDWVHFDLMAWNTQAQSGKPKGGEALALLTMFEYLKTRYK